MPFVDPFWWQRTLWFLVEAWMLQFDADDIDRSDVILWWLIWRAPEIFALVQRAVSQFWMEVSSHG